MPALTVFDPSSVFLNTTTPTVLSPTTVAEYPSALHQRRYSTHEEHRLHKRDIIIDTPGGNPSACWSGYACQPYYADGIFPGHYASCVPKTTETTSTSTDGGTVFVIISQSQDVCGQCVCHYDGPTSGSGTGGSGTSPTYIPIVTVTVTNWGDGGGSAGSIRWGHLGVKGGIGAKMFWIGWAAAVTLIASS